MDAELLHNIQAIAELPDVDGITVAHVMCSLPPADRLDAAAGVDRTVGGPTNMSMQLQASKLSVALLRSVANTQYLQAAHDPAVTELAAKVGLQLGLQLLCCEQSSPLIKNPRWQTKDVFRLSTSNIKHLTTQFLDSSRRSNETKVRTVAVRLSLLRLRLCHLFVLLCPCCSTCARRSLASLLSRCSTMVSPQINLSTRMPPSCLVAAARRLRVPWQAKRPRLSSTPRCHACRR